MAITLPEILIKFGIDKTEVDEAFEDIRRGANTVDFALKAIGFVFVANQVKNLTQEIFGLVGAQSEAIAVTDSYGRRLGIATDELIAMQTAAAQFNIEQEELNEGLKNMSERIADAYINRTGAAGDALIQLGLNIEDIARMTPEEQFLEIADALSQVEDEAQRTFLAMEIGQEEFFRLQELISLGSDGIKELINDTKFLNAELTAVDFENIRAMEVSAGNAGLAFDSIIDQISADLAPIMERIFDISAEWFAIFRDEGLPVITEFIGDFVDGGLEIVENVLPEILTIGSAVWDGLATGVEALWSVISPIFNLIAQGWGLIFEDITGDSNWIEVISDSLSIAARSWPQLIANAFLNIAQFITGAIGTAVEFIEDRIFDIQELALTASFAAGVIDQDELDAGIDTIQTARTVGREQNFFQELEQEQQRLIEENEAIIQDVADQVVAERQANEETVSSLIERLTTLTPEQRERITGAEFRSQQRGRNRGSEEARARADAEKERNRQREQFAAITADTSEAFKVFNRDALDGPAANAQERQTQAIQETTQAVLQTGENIVNGILGLVEAIPGVDPIDRAKAFEQLKIITKTGV